MTQVAKHDVYADVDGIRTLVAAKHQPVPAVFEQYVDKKDLVDDAPPTPIDYGRDLPAPAPEGDKELKATLKETQGKLNDATKEAEAQAGEAEQLRARVAELEQQLEQAATGSVAEPTPDKPAPKPAAPKAPARKPAAKKAAAKK